MGSNLVSLFLGLKSVFKVPKFREIIGESIKIKFALDSFLTIIILALK